MAKGQRIKQGFALQDSDYVNGIAEGQNGTFQTLTALAGGTQSNLAPVIKPDTLIAAITIVATGNDSVTLPFATAGKVLYVQNNTANSARLYVPLAVNKITGIADVINNAAAFFDVTSESTFVCGVNGFWGAR